MTTRRVVSEKLLAQLAEARKLITHNGDRTKATESTKRAWDRRRAAVIPVVLDVESCRLEYRRCMAVFLALEVNCGK